MPDDEARLESLTIYLAKEGLEKPSDTISHPEQLQSFELSDEDGKLGTLYVKSRPAKPPRWGHFFVPPLKLTDFGRVSSTAAVFHVIVDDRALLLTFGQGRYLLEPGSVEERFGLRVTLNSIAADRVRSIDKHTLDTIGRHTRVQASKEATAGEFGLDIEQDLLRAITGTPDDPALGRTISGLDSLHAVVRVTLDSLRPLLSKYLAQSVKETYKQTFPWVDHITNVKDAALKERLDALMMAAAIEGRSDKCWLAVPEPIEWERIAGFRYGKGAKHALVHDISFPSFIADIGGDAQAMTIDLFKKRHAAAVDSDDVDLYKWSVYRCIYCEVEDGNNTYLLSGGHWYKVASDFVGEVNGHFQRIPRYDAELPSFADETEGAYNQRVAEANRGTFALMDAKLISVGGGYSKVEFCDLFSRKNEIIHVKRYGGSGVLSHLFAQGVVSGQLFVSDSGFRTAVNSMLPASYKLHDALSRPNADSYRIIFGIISREVGQTLTLPFFSRLNARHAVRTLGGYGYKVELAKIRIDDTVAKTKKFGAARRSG